MTQPNKDCPECHGTGVYTGSLFNGVTSPCSLCVEDVNPWIPTTPELLAKHCPRELSKAERVQMYGADTDVTQYVGTWECVSTASPSLVTPHALAGYERSGKTAQWRRVILSPRELKMIKEAIGDGVTDDTAALQQARPLTLLQQCEQNEYTGPTAEQPFRTTYNYQGVENEASWCNRHHGSKGVYFPIGAYVYFVPWDMLQSSRDSHCGDPTLWPSRTFLCGNTTSKGFRIIEHPTDGRRAAVPWRPA